MGGISGLAGGIEGKRSKVTRSKTSTEEIKILPGEILQHKLLKKAIRQARKKIHSLL